VDRKGPPVAAPLLKKEAANLSKRSDKAQESAPVNHRKQLPRLRRIEGQVRGLQQMIEKERNSVDVAHQISACIAALARVRGDMLRDHLAELIEATIQGKLPEAKRRRLAEEVGALLARMT
jgi:DNA-binding FrmR family transcriptional regulator